MTTLKADSMADNVTYNYLHTTNQVTQTFDDAGDVKVGDFGYWNPSDPDASAQGAKLYGYGLVHYCLQHATYYGTAWKDSTSSGQSNAITKLINIMSKESSLVSDISAQLGSMFNFKAVSG